VAPPPDDRTPLALAIAWATTATTIALEMTIPALLGVGLDRWLGIPIVFTALGAIAGLTLGVLHLMRMTTPGKPLPGSKRASSQHVRQPDSTTPGDDPSADRGRGRTEP
jgi:hypothetical protein